MEGFDDVDARAGTIGRDEELARLRAFARAETADRIVMIVGPPGIGKTTLWEATVLLAQAGARVLTARPAEAEARLAFSTLSDLLAGVEGDALASLPAPQRRALDVALLRLDAAGRPPEPRAIALGLTGILGALARKGRILVAVDDMQWSDQSTVDALAFAIRRAPEGLRILLTRRPGRRSRFETAVRGQVATLAIGGLSLGATRRLLASRLGLQPSRRVLREVQDATLGNPLFVLEIGRTLLEGRPPAIGEGLRLPESLEDLLGARVTSSGKGRVALLAVALAGAVPVAEINAAVSVEAVEAAVDSGLLLDGTDRLRPAHPLLATAAIRHSTGRERRELHASLARAAADPVRRARHLASATPGTDVRLASVVERAAATALARGASEQAIELQEHALRLTPLRSHRRDSRVLALGDYLVRADEPRRLKEMLSAEFPRLAPGDDRARGLLLYSWVPDSQEEYERHLEAALREAEDPQVRALVLAERAIDATASWLAGLDVAETWAREALSLARDGVGGWDAAHALGWVRILRGQGIEDLRARYQQDDQDKHDPARSLERLEGIRLAFRGQIDQARAIFERSIARAGESGEFNSQDFFYHQLCELALRAGDVIAATTLIEDKTNDPTERLGLRSHVARLHAVLAALRGDREATERWASTTLDLVIGQRWDVLEVARVRGLGALLAGQPARARDELLSAWAHTEAEGIDDPGAFPVAADLIEAAMALGEADLATGVLQRLRHLSLQQNHPWGLASVLRGEGVMGLANDAGDEVARTKLANAAERYDAIGCRFDAARSVLALGKSARRGRKWAVARDALGRAAARFEELGCDGWAADARSQLEGLGGRRPAADGALTPTEGRVAQLAGEGRSNKEIGAALFVSVHTVEVHLAHAYAKLGVQSRAQLARALPQALRDPAPIP